MVVGGSVVVVVDDVVDVDDEVVVASVAGTEAGADTAKAILEHARDHLAPFLKVRRVEFFELPKTISGKIRRVELRKAEVERAQTGAAPDGYGTEFREEDLDLQR